MTKISLLAFVFTIFLAVSSVVATDVNVTVNVTTPTVAKRIATIGLTPLVMSAGALIWLGRVFIGSPESPKDLTDLAVATVIIFLVLVSAIGIVVGLI